MRNKNQNYIHISFEILLKKAQKSKLYTHFLRNIIEKGNKIRVNSCNQLSTIIFLSFHSGITSKYKSFDLFRTP